MSDNQGAGLLTCKVSQTLNEVIPTMKSDIGLGGGGTLLPHPQPPCWGHGWGRWWVVFQFVHVEGTSIRPIMGYDSRLNRELIFL